jgi:hypothetical protein
MGVGLVVLWCGLAVLLAAVFHRLRKRAPALAPEVQQFLRRFEQELAQHDGVEFLGMLPGQFAGLLRVRGQETPVSLHELFRRNEAFPDRFAQSVAQLLEEIGEDGLDRLDHHEFGGVAVDLMPQVKSLAWVEQQGRFGDSAIVHRRFGEDLAIVYVVDDPHSMTFVCRAHCKRWGRTVDDVHQLAMQNLQKRCAADSLPAAAAGAPVMLQSGDGYDAARVLLLPKGDDVLVAMPDRDVLWVALDEGQDLSALERKATTMSLAAAHPVSGRVYRLAADGPKPVIASTEG